MVGALLATPANAQEADADDAPPPPPAEDVAPPYEDQLERLSEVLGSLHFLRQICTADDAEDWRQSMASFIDAEQPSPRRRAKFVALFNRGYEGFSALYTSCTPQATQATKRYLREGRALSEGIVNRYGN
ncbi:MAG: TIGR02301 family protein [Pseudomonadota bacterium]